MSVSSLIQLFSSCVGIVGSLFFAIGVIRQSTEAMGKLSQSYYDSNPHMPRTLGRQKADYVFGGSLIVVAFTLQFASFLAPSTVLVVEASSSGKVLALAFFGTLITFLLFLLAARKLGAYYERRVTEWLVQAEEEHERKRAAEKAAQRAAQNATTT